jgi:general secretion pathway protein I
MKMPARFHHRGFTLIEVMVALAVVALGIGALLSTLNTAAGSITHMRDRSYAEWIALNRISQTRLAAEVPSTGETSGEVEYAGSKWLWRQEVIDQDVAGILRLEVSVGRVSDKASKAGVSGEKFPALATAYGFKGTEVGVSAGQDPTWTQTEPRNPGSLNPGLP